MIIERVLGPQPKILSAALYPPINGALRSHLLTFVALSCGRGGPCVVPENDYLTRKGAVSIRLKFSPRNWQKKGVA